MDLARRQQSAQDRLLQYEDDKRKRTIVCVYTAYNEHQNDEKPYVPAVGEWLVVHDDDGTTSSSQSDPRSQLRKTVRTSVNILSK